MAQWLSWLERRPVTAEVESSSLFWVVSLIYGVLAQLGEHLPYKQRVIGSSPIGPTSKKLPTGWQKKYADVAQLAEQLICNQQVIGSSPIIGFDKKLSDVFIKQNYVDGFPSGQRGQTVNLLSTTSKVRILLHPFIA